MVSRPLVEDPELPDIDDRLAVPGTPFEVMDGRLVRVSPADSPHGELHAQIAALLEAHTGYDFTVAIDRLTRTSKVDDIAPDISVNPSAPHPETGRRQLEQLAFELVSEQSLRHAGRKAAKLAGRGVRRVFAIDIKKARALEWSTEHADWVPLDSAGVIEDSALEVPLPIDALIRAARADDAQMRALIKKGNPVFVAEQAAAEAKGKAQGLAEGVLIVLDARGIALTDDQRARILAERDAERLGRWQLRAVTCAAASELLDDGR